MKFSERYGYKPVRSVLQIADIDDALRNRLWNAVCQTFFEDAPTVGSSAVRYLGADSSEYQLFLLLAHNFFKETTDSVSSFYTPALTRVREYFFGCLWHGVYDLIEFLAEAILNRSKKTEFIETINQILKEEMAGYRFVSDHIVQITSEEEIAEIEQSVNLSGPLKPVTEHFRQALALMADRKNPDHRNSIKESISAIESLSKIVSGLPKTTLGPALNAVEKKTKIHSDLKEAFQKLYGYTSDAQGIRHALMREPTLDFEDAKFMLVSCSAFVNYLIVKAQKAGIKI
jgi:hypothetical protein